MKTLMKGGEPAVNQLVETGEVGGIVLRESQGVGSPVNVGKDTGRPAILLQEAEPKRGRSVKTTEGRGGGVGERAEMMGDGGKTEIRRGEEGVAFEEREAEVLGGLSEVGIGFLATRGRQLAVRAGEGGEKKRDMMEEVSVGKKWLGREGWIGVEVSVGGF